MTRSGKSHSRRPISKRTPTWLRYVPEEVEAFVIKLAKEGQTLSRIGVTLRDQYGIPLVKNVTGKSILAILEEANLKPSTPEDISNLLAKASDLQRHLSKNRSDALNRRSLEIVISKIRSAGRYYKRIGRLPDNWEYRAETTHAL
ncbi:30S ribosomal protein S15 [Candidatus Bathyarchaeota archaeon]|nr:30S ribosomal protein S15 [Candidatus Bathyarchaeota archaeon]